MGIKNGLLMLAAGIFLTFTWTQSTPVFDPRLFGVAVLVASAFSLGPDLVLRMPRRRFATTFARPETVLPRRHRHG